MESLKQVLIISDGKKGHLNQSIALATHLGYRYDILEVHFKSKWHKMVSYIFDKFFIYTDFLFVSKEVMSSYDIVVGAGSGTYYAVRVFAKKNQVKSITMMLPRGYRYDFDTIFAQAHDNPPKQKNIIEIPANFSFAIPASIYKPQKRSIGVVIGGNNKILTINSNVLKKQLDFIVANFKGYEIAVTTSPRTPREIENLIQSYHFDYEVIYSQNPINPIPDFVEHCETLFITSDSTSMISEAISAGESNVVILPVDGMDGSKFEILLLGLARGGYLHIFDGTLESKNKKIDFKEYLKGLDL